MIQPIREHVLIKPYASDTISAGGILLSEAHKEISNKVKVIAVGKGTKDKPMKFTPGETVFRVKDVGDEILIDGERHFIVKQTWLLAKLN